LAAYLAGLGWLATLFTTALALWDGGHRVRIEAGTRGIRVVLSHDGQHRPDRPHQLLGSALTAFAEPTSPAAPDHVIELGPGGGIVARLDAPGRIREPGVASGPVAYLPTAWAPAMPSGPPNAGPDRSRFTTAFSVRVARTHVLRC